MIKPPIEILYKDDKKEKHQSHLFTIDITNYGINTDFNSNLTGYGDNKQAAKSNILEAIVELRKMLDEAEKQLNES